MIEPSEKEHSLKKEIQYSLVFHALVLGCFTIKTFVFPGEDIDYQSAVRVDIVDLPDKIVNKPNIAKPKPVPKAVKKPPPPKKVVPKPAKKPPVKNTVNLKNKQQSAIDRMQALEKLKEESKIADNQADALNKIKEFKGNVVSKGAALDGIIADQKNAFIGQLDVFIKQYWNLPRWLSEESLSASVLVKIDSRGYVTFRQIQSSSGNGDYDNIAIQTIDSASPFPTPPSNLASTLRDKGFTIEFDNQEK